MEGVHAMNRRQNSQHGLKRLLASAVAVAGILTPAVTAAGAEDRAAKAETSLGNMTISSSAFKEGQRIPDEYTAAGKNISPPLSWSSAPAGTQSFALICDDPDAPVGTWIHWVIYNIPGTEHALAENLPPQETLPDGAAQGVNSWSKVGYGGPAPPPGKTHRYFFKLYALDKKLSLAPRANKAQLLAAMIGHIVAEGQTMGTYSR